MQNNKKYIQLVDSVKSVVQSGNHNIPYTYEDIAHVIVLNHPDSSLAEQKKLIAHYLSKRNSKAVVAVARKAPKGKSSKTAYMRKYLAKKKETAPEWMASRMEYSKEWLKKRLESDPEYARMHKDRCNEWQKNKRKEDPKYAEKMRKYKQAWRKKRKKQTGSYT